MRFFISKNELHLVAYIEENGGEVTYQPERMGWLVSTNRKEAEWRKMHRNSEAFKVDNRLLALKKAMR